MTASRAVANTGRVVGVAAAGFTFGRAMRSRPVTSILTAELPLAVACVVAALVVLTVVARFSRAMDEEQNR